MATRVLIADDNPVFRKTLRRLLEEFQHWEVIEAGDGDEAVRKSLENRPDVVVLDLAMPVKDGLTAAREISQALPEIPILMCTMHASPQLEIEAQKSGVRQIISKTESSVIIPAIQQLVAKKPAADPVAVAPQFPAAMPGDSTAIASVQAADTSSPVDLPPISTDAGSEPPVS
jgi:two-component system, NarL family, response regulator DesR